MRAVGVLLFLAMGAIALAQSRVPPQKPTLEGTLVLPAQLGNKIFGRLTSPLGEFDLSLQFPLWKGLGAGLGGSAMGWELKKTTFSQLNTQGDAGRLTYYAKVQYVRYTGPNAFYEVNVKVGKSRWKWDCATCEQDVMQQGLHWSATTGYYVHASDNLAFGVTAGFETDAVKFTPAVLCLEDFPGYLEKSGPYDFFTVGLGFSTRFEKSKEERW
jgi:hypothetical protein